MARRLYPLLGAGLAAVAVAFAQEAVENEPAGADHPPVPPPEVTEGPEAGATGPGESRPVEPVEDPGPDPALVARDLVERLADEQFLAREAATKALWELGEDAMEALQDGMASPEPEIAHRAKLLLRRIRTGITPTTPQAIIELVQRYDSSGVNGKKRVFEQLLEEKAYVQMLRLYRFEKDLAVREDCDEILSKAIQPAILAELVAGRVDEAQELLELAPATDQNCRRRVAILRARGELQDALRESEREPLFDEDGNLVQRTKEMDAAAMRLALLRGSGDAAAARVLAGKMGRRDLVAALALFEGDPVPYLSWFADQQDRSPVLRLHAEIALKRWQGDEAGAAKLAKSLAEVAREGGEEERDALLSLMLNGYMEHARPVIERDYPESAFNLYETTEQPLKALASIGYSGSDAKKAAWRETRLKALRKDWDDSDSERFDLLSVASFLQTRGESDEALGMIRSLGEISAQEGIDTWREFLGQLHDIGGSLHELGFHLAAERFAEEAEDRDERAMLTVLIGEGETAQQLWDLLGKTQDVPVSERLLLLGAVYGAVHRAPEKLDPVLDGLRAAVRETKEDDRVVLLAALLEAAEIRDDAGSALALIEELLLLEADGPWSRKVAGYCAHVADWENALKSLQTLAKTEPTNLRVLALQAGALFRVDRHDEAREILRRVELFALDESVRLRQVAYDLDRQGAEDEAEHYWRQLMMTSSPSDWYWHPSAEPCTRHAKRGKRWREAAAFAEVDAMQYLRGRSTYLNPVIFIRKRFAADLYRGLALLEEGDAPAARKLFRGCFELLNGDGVLADDYFPLLREAGIIDEHDRNYAIVAQRLQDSLKAFPKAHNTHNSAAWMSSRASRNLDQALHHIETALAMRPRQAAYLDTMAEVWFARHDRPKAVEWSRRAISNSYHGGYGQPETGLGLRDQYERFLTAPFPVP